MPKRSSSECARLCPVLPWGAGRVQTARGSSGSQKQHGAAAHHPGLCHRVPAAREAARARVWSPPRAPPSSPSFLFSSCSSWNCLKTVQFVSAAPFTGVSSSSLRKGSTKHVLSQVRESLDLVQPRVQKLLFLLAPSPQAGR